MPTSPLPAPAPVQIYDGHCVFCAWSTRFILAHEAAPRIRFVALTSAQGRALAQAHDVNPDDPLTFLFIDGSMVMAQSTAVLAIAAYLRWPWRALGVARIIPRPLSDMAYRLVARHRYRLFGRSITCLVPDAAARARFTLPGSP